MNVENIQNKFSFILKGYLKVTSDNYSGIVLNYKMLLPFNT